MKTLKVKESRDYPGLFIINGFPGYLINRAGQVYRAPVGRVPFNISWQGTTKVGPAVYMRQASTGAQHKIPVAKLLLAVFKSNPFGADFTSQRIVLIDGNVTNLSLDNIRWSEVVAEPKIIHATGAASEAERIQKITPDVRAMNVQCFAQKVSDGTIKRFDSMGECVDFFRVANKTLAALWGKAKTVRCPEGEPYLFALSETGFSQVAMVYRFTVTNKTTGAVYDFNTNQEACDFIGVSKTSLTASRDYNQHGFRDFVVGDTVMCLKRIIEELVVPKLRLAPKSPWDFARRV